MITWFESFTDTGSSDADDSMHVLRCAISRVSTQDSPLPSFSAGDLGDLCRQTSKDNRSLLVELVEMRRKKELFKKKLFLAIYSSVLSLIKSRLGYHSASRFLVAQRLG